MSLYTIMPNLLLLMVSRPLFMPTYDWILLTNLVLYCVVVPCVSILDSLDEFSDKLLQCIVPFCSS